MSHGPSGTDPLGMNETQGPNEVKYHPRFASKGGGGRGTVKDAQWAEFPMKVHNLNSLV